MRIKSKTYEVKENEFEARMSEWHNWFAWYPVRISDTELVWLQIVKRKAIEFSTFGSPYWLYKL